jgi:hypothetical protein
MHVYMSYIYKPEGRAGARGALLIAARLWLKFSTEVERQRPSGLAPKRPSGLGGSTCAQRPAHGTRGGHGARALEGACGLTQAAS